MRSSVKYNSGHLPSIDEFGNYSGMRMEIESDNDDKVSRIKYISRMENSQLLQT